MLRVRALLAALAFGVTLTAFAAEKTFTFRLTGEPETLDWNRAHTPIETYLLLNLMEGLVSFDEKMKVVPALAKSWKVSPDGKTYTFSLRPGVEWSDGIPLKAQDFVYSWERLLTPATAAAYAYILFDVEGAEDFSKGKNKDFAKVGIKALDDLTVQVRLVRPVAYWLYIPTFWVTFPLRRDIVQQFGGAWATPGRMVSVGPYTLSSHDIDRRVVLKANPKYYGKRGNVTEVIGQVVQDDSTALTLYETGKIDFLTDIGSLDLSKLMTRWDLKKFPYLKTAYLGFVGSKYPSSSSAFRRAVAMAIDKSKLGKVLHGGQESASSFVPPSMLAHSKKAGLPFDPSRARSELRAAGVDPATAKIEIVLPNLEKPRTIAQFIQAELKRNLGLNVELQAFDNKTFRAQVDLKAYPLFILSWGADYPDPDNFLSVFLGSAGNNRTAFSNAKYDDLIVKARAARGESERKKLYDRAQKILLEEEAAIAPLYYEPNLALVRDRVKGVILNPLNYLYVKGVNIVGP
jgi:oligopeptide transport system substrate-binding protein